MKILTEEEKEHIHGYIEDVLKLKEYYLNLNNYYTIRKSFSFSWYMLGVRFRAFKQAIKFTIYDLIGKK